MASNLTPCNCQSETDTKSRGTTQRPRYYARQLVTPEDLTLEQDYFRAKLRRHNRYLHGTGVVCGAGIALASKPWKVLVQTGYVLGPYGDEICIEADVCVDVRQRCTSSTPTPADDDCGCSDAQPAPPSDATQFIAIRYQEVKARPVRVPLGGCGCETNSCEFSRFTDGYEICVLDDCNASGDAPPSLDSLKAGTPPACPPAPTSPWVVLGAFTVDSEGTVSIDQCNCRRQVLGLGAFYWNCHVGDL